MAARCLGVTEARNSWTDWRVSDRSYSSTGGRRPGSRRSSGARRARATEDVHGDALEVRAWVFHRPNPRPPHPDRGEGILENVLRFCRIRRHQAQRSVHPLVLLREQLLEGDGRRARSRLRLLGTLVSACTSSLTPVSRHNASGTFRPELEEEPEVPSAQSCPRSSSRMAGSQFPRTLENGGTEESLGHGTPREQRPLEPRTPRELHGNSPPADS
jgi:hypothetical protein